MIYLVKITNRIYNCFFKIFLKLIYGNKIKIGKKVIFRKNVHITIEKNGKLIIGDYCFFNNGCSINCMNKIVIGKNNLFGENVKIYDHDHKINILNRNKSFNFGIVEIGNNNWFCSDCIILRKAKINDNSIFSCKCVINNIFQSNVIVKSKINYDLQDIEYIERS